MESDEWDRRRAPTLKARAVYASNLLSLLPNEMAMPVTKKADIKRNVMMTMSAMVMMTAERYDHQMTSSRFGNAHSISKGSDCIEVAPITNTFSLNLSFLGELLALLSEPAVLRQGLGVCGGWGSDGCCRLITVAII